LSANSATSDDARRGKSRALPAIMTIPLILFILPTLFIVIMGPAACSIADSSLGGG
jgi:tight adherence protein C